MYRMQALHAQTQADSAAAVIADGQRSQAAAKELIFTEATEEAATAVEVGLSLLVIEGLHPVDVRHV